MSEERVRQFVRLAVTVSALTMAAIGLALLAAPGEAGGALIPGDGGGPLVQLLGAALIGAAAMNWTARGSVLGGIYGRAIVAGNQAHLTIGALLLARHGFAAGGSVAYWVLTGVYLLGAGLFSYLMFFNSGIQARPIHD
jgi:hypothetical protein